MMICDFLRTLLSSLGCLILCFAFLVSMLGMTCCVWWRNGPCRRLCRAWSHLLWLIPPVLLHRSNHHASVEPLALAEMQDQSHGWQCLGEGDSLV